MALWVAAALLLAAVVVGMGAGRLGAVAGRRPLRGHQHRLHAVPQREPVIELVAVASGFVLRAIAGGVATHVPLSNWLLVVTSFGALFVVTGKRRRSTGRSAGPGAAPPGPGALHRQLPQFHVDPHGGGDGHRLLPVGLRAHRAHVPGRASLHLDPAHRRAGGGGPFAGAPPGRGGDGGAPEELVLHDRSLQLLAVLWAVLFSVGLYG